MEDCSGEGSIHGQKPEEVFLHEVGGLDTIIDITGAIIGLNYFHIKGFASTILPALVLSNCPW